jgi:hypothetical protein
MAQFPPEAGNIAFVGGLSPINPAKPACAASLGFRGASGDFVFRALSREQKGK